MNKRHYLIYILLGFVFLGTVIFATINYNNTKRFVLESVERETDELLNNFTAEVNRFSMERTADIELMADHLPYLIERGEDITTFLSLQTDHMPYFTGLGFITPDGEIQAADGNRFPVQQQETFEQALMGEVSFSDVFKLNQDDSQNVTAISVPVVSKDGKIVGVISGVVNLSHLVSELVEESNLPGTVFLLKDHDMLFSSDYQSTFDKTLPDSEAFLKLIDRKLDGSWDDPEDDLRFIKYQTTWNDWVVVVDSSSNEATDKISETRLLSILIVVVTIIIVGIISFYLVRLQVREKLQTEQDLLTGLGNRRQLERNVAKRKMQYPNEDATFYFIKLDRFSELTEHMGYYLSDQVLFFLSKKLNSMQKKFNVYRVGDEEFVMISQISSCEKQREFAEELIRRIEEPIYIEQSKTILLTASIGVRTVRGAEDLTLVMQDALFACHEASKLGGNQYVYFTKELAKESEQQRQLATNLETAFENEEFYLVYQPIYSCFNNRIVSFEALMRWKSPALGEVGPVQFIPLLEANDKIIDVGRWLIKEVAEQVNRWEDQGYDDFVITLNVSTKQLQYDHFLSDVMQILDETRVNPYRLVFEVTESVVVQDIEGVSTVLEMLNSLGIETAIDDFGTGYSSLAILKTLPFQYMKLDRAFVMEVISDGGISKAILEGLIEIANSLGLTTITEGVETFDQLEVLRKLGAHRIQGYYFSKPILPEEAVKFLNITTFDHETEQWF